MAGAKERPRLHWARPADPEAVGPKAHVQSAGHLLCPQPAPRNLVILVEFLLSEGLVPL